MPRSTWSFVRPRRRAVEDPRQSRPLQLHFAEVDDRVNATWAPYKAALDAERVRYEVFHYPKTQHGFHNDTTPRYDAQAAKTAWTRTLAFFKKHLR